MNSVSSSLQFKIDWLDSIDGVECQTLASIGLIVDGAPVWPVRGEIVEDFELFADELLAHLAECWKPLILRQSYPIPIQPERPSFLAAEAAKRWSQMPDAAVDSEQLELSNFEDIHNLTNAFGGITGLSPLWFLRDQDSMVVDTQELYFEIPIGEAIRSLEAAGNQIAERLRKGDDQKWARLLTAWHRRNEGDRTRLLALTIGRDQATAAALVADNIIEPPSSFADAANDNDELRIAARMAGPMPLLQIKSVIKIVGACKLRNAPRLKEMSDAAMQFLYSHELTNARPHNQGNEVALWLRRSLSLSPDRSVDPIRILEYQFNVDVRAIDFGISSLDAIAVWGPKHGPSVLINLTSRQLQPICNDLVIRFCRQDRRRRESWLRRRFR
ncbi:MAG: hypothetical protein ACREDC_03305 [Bradyrhizobium sp.]